MDLDIASAEASLLRGMPRLRAFLLTHGRYLTGIFTYGSSFAALQFSRVLVGLIAAKWLGPQVYGAWYLCATLLNYSDITGLGIMNALNCELPVALAAGDKRRARLLTDTSAGAHLLSTFGGIGILAVGVALFASSETKSPLLWTLCIIFAMRIYSFYDVYLRATNRFSLLSRTQIALTVILPAAILPLILNHGLNGLFIGYTASYLVASAIPIWKTWGEFRICISKVHAIELIKYGLPIMLVGVLYTLMTTADRWVVAKFKGIEELGFYSLAGIASNALRLVSAVVSQKTLPTMAAAWGATKNVSSLRSWLKKQQIVGAFLMAGLAIALVLILPPVIHRFLPKYVQGIAAMQIACLACILQALAAGYANVLFTVGHQRKYLAVVAGTLIISLLLCSILVQTSLGINGAAISTGFALLLTVIGLSWTTRRVLSRLERESALPQAIH